MTTYSPQRCAELLALREKANQGPFEHSYLCDDSPLDSFRVYTKTKVYGGSNLLCECSGDSAEVECNAAYIASIHDLHDQLKAAQEIMRRQREALEFYANGDTYLAIGIRPDPPCGEFMDDFSMITDEEAFSFETERPGKRAREALSLLPTGA